MIKNREIIKCKCGYHGNDVGILLDEGKTWIKPITRVEEDEKSKARCPICQSTEITFDTSCEDFAQCIDCGYKGNKGMWCGTITIADDKKPLNGIVPLLDDDTWGCDDLMSDVDDYDDFDGEAMCPVCGSANFY